MMSWQPKRHISIASVVGLAAGLASGSTTYSAYAEETFLLNSEQRVVRYVDPDGLATMIEYDAVGNPIEIQSQRGRARFGFDAIGRHAWTEDDVGLVSYDYDAANHLVAIRYSLEKNGRPVFRQVIRYPVKKGSNRINRHKTHS